MPRTKSEKSLSPQLPCRLPKESALKLTALAEKAGITVAQAVRDLLENELDRQPEPSDLDIARARKKLEKKGFKQTRPRSLRAHAQMLRAA